MFNGTYSLGSKCTNKKSELSIYCQWWMSDLLQDPFPGLGSLSCIQAWPANSDGVPEPPKDPADCRFCCADTQHFIYRLYGFLLVNPMEGFSVKPGLQPLLCEMRSSMMKAAQELHPCCPVSGKLALQDPIVRYIFILSHKERDTTDALSSHAFKLTFLASQCFFQENIFVHGKITNRKAASVSRGMM